MNQQQQQVPTINGVPLNELPDLCQKLFDKVMLLRQEEQELGAKHAQKKMALEELANMLAAEVEQFKASSGAVEANPVE